MSPRHFTASDEMLLDQINPVRMYVLCLFLHTRRINELQVSSDRSHICRYSLDRKIIITFPPDIGQYIILVKEYRYKIINKM